MSRYYCGRTGCGIDAEGDRCDECGVRLAADGTEPYGGEQVLLATILRAMNEEALVEAGQNSLDREVYLIQQIVNLLHDSSGTRARRVLGYILSRVADLP